MAGGLTISVLGILSWMKEHQPEGYRAVKEIATPFHLNQDSMLVNLQWLQRYECVKHEGSGNAAWSIIDIGILQAHPSPDRLARIKTAAG